MDRMERRLQEMIDSGEISEYEARKMWREYELECEEDARRKYGAGEVKER